MSIGTFLCAWGAVLSNFGYVSAIAWSAVISRHVKRCIIGDTKTGMHSFERENKNTKRGEEEIAVVIPDNGISEHKPEHVLFSFVNNKKDVSN